MAGAFQKDATHVFHPAETGQPQDTFKREVGLAHQPFGTIEAAVDDFIQNAAPQSQPEAPFKGAPVHAQGRRDMRDGHFLVSLRPDVVNGLLYQRIGYGFRGGGRLPGQTLALVGARFIVQRGGNDGQPVEGNA